MTWQQRLVHEAKSVGLASLYFGCWLAALVIVKKLILEEYQIEFSGMSKALVGTLVLSKVVLVLEHVPLGSWVRKRPVWVNVLLRTALYALGVFVVLLLERGIEGRHEYGDLGRSLAEVFQHSDIYHVWANAICLSGALLGYNLLFVIRRRLGKGGLRDLFLTPLPEGSEEN